MKDLQFYFDNYYQINDKVFKKIYQLSSKQLYGVIFRILKNKELSEECLQEVFIKIYHNFDNYDSSKAKALTWMITITRNYSIDFIRKKKLDIADDYDLDVIDDEQIKILQDIEDSEHKRQLEKCLNSLKKEVKQAVYFIYYHNKTYEEIGRLFNKPLNTVKSWVVRSLPKLKLCLEKVYER